ncbi:MAG: hypothetical protein D6698_05010 [Gammaproteobacteria bacterium]|nr:MAG: hypothetical protein D6698_05010 [Gammaproteobacteria bacterium]
MRRNDIELILMETPPAMLRSRLAWYLAKYRYSDSAVRTLVFSIITRKNPHIEIAYDALRGVLPPPIVAMRAQEALHGPSGGEPLRDPLYQERAMELIRLAKTEEIQQRLQLAQTPYQRVKLLWQYGRLPEEYQESLVPLFMHGELQAHTMRQLNELHHQLDWDKAEVRSNPVPHLHVPQKVTN